MKVADTNATTKISANEIRNGEGTQRPNLAKLPGLSSVSNSSSPAPRTMAEWRSHGLKSPAGLDHSQQASQKMARALVPVLKRASQEAHLLLNACADRFDSRTSSKLEMNFEEYRSFAQSTPHMPSMVSLFDQVVPEPGFAKKLTDSVVALSDLYDQAALSEARSAQTVEFKDSGVLGDTESLALCRLIDILDEGERKLSEIEGNHRVPPVDPDPIGTGAPA